MLTALRRAAESLVAKILFLLLTASFAIWGIGDVVRNIFQPDTSVATVAGQRIGLDEAMGEYRRELANLTRQFAGRFEPTEAIRRTIAEQVVTRLAAGHAIDAEAGRMGLVIGEEALRQAVFALPVFAGPDRRFSPALFQNFLRNQGMGEPQFLALLRADLARQTLITAVRGGAAAPSLLARDLTRFIGETRTADIAAIDAGALPAPPAPDEAALRRWYDTHAEDFTAPEYRSILVAALGPDQLAGEVEVSEADIAAAFAARARELGQPERRDADQLQLPDEAAAGVLAAQWKLGADWATMAAHATEAGGTANRLGLVGRDAIPIPSLAEAVFGAAEPGVVGPLRTPFGWAVVRINRIEPGHTPTLQQAAPELRAAIARERAADLVYARERTVEDALAGGAGLEEVARQNGMAVFTATVDAEGRDERGSAVELGPAAREALAAAFAASPADEPRLSEAPGGVFYAVKVLGITPAAPKPFEAVRDSVEAAWTADARSRAAEEAATALMTASRAPGATLADAARAANVALSRSPPIPRPSPEAPQVVAPEMARAVFALTRPGEASMVRTPGGFAVIALAEIIPAPLDTAAIARMRTEVSRAVGGDVEQVFVDQLRARAGVELNPRNIDLLARP